MYDLEKVKTTCGQGDWRTWVNFWLRQLLNCNTIFTWEYGRNHGGVVRGTFSPLAFEKKGLKSRNVNAIFTFAFTPFLDQEIINHFYFCLPIWKTLCWRPCLRLSTVLLLTSICINSVSLKIHCIAKTVLVHCQNFYVKS